MVLNQAIFEKKKCLQVSMYLIFILLREGSTAWILQ